MKQRSGFILVTVLLVLVVLMALVTAYFFLTNVELATTSASADGSSGFYAAEAGLNVRGEQVRQTFLGYNRPSGRLYTAANVCASQGDYLAVGPKDDFVCQDFTIGQRRVVTYVREDPNNFRLNANIAIENSNRFRGLIALEYKYSVFSQALNPQDGEVEAQLEMVFRSRLVPLFQFAVFYNKDLEINPGADMMLTGRVHTNGDLYLSPDAKLDITGAVTVAQKGDGTGGSLYRRRKDANTCTGTVLVDDAKTSTTVNPPISGCGKIAQTTLDAWNGQVETATEAITVPEVKEFAIGGEYWNKADFRLALDLRGSSPKVIVPYKSSTPSSLTANPTLTSQLASCTASSSLRSYPQPLGLLTSLSPVLAAEYSQNSFEDKREGGRATLLEVDVPGLLNCLHQHRTTLFQESQSAPRDINDTSDGGLVIYTTVIGPDSSGYNRYGVRFRNGNRLAATVGGAPAIQGLTFVSDQAAYIQGDYNAYIAPLEFPRKGWRPASFLADSINILSKSYDQAGHDTASLLPITSVLRAALPTTINAAFLSGTDTTGNREGANGQNGAYNGGLENYPRLHENWTHQLLSYKGSFASLYNAQHVRGAWQLGQVYAAPLRNFSYDERFNAAENLPPLSPRFVYLEQERFVRNFER